MTLTKKCVEEAVEYYRLKGGDRDAWCKEFWTLLSLAQFYLSGELGVMASEEEIIASLFKWDGKVMRMERMREIADALVGKIASVGRVEELEAKKSEYRAALEKIVQFKCVDHEFVWEAERDFLKIIDITTTALKGQNGQEV